MLELVYLSLLGIACYCSKVAIIDRTEEDLMGLIAMILFAGLAFTSLSVRPTFSPDETVSMEPMLWLTGVAALLNFAIVMLAMTNKLPSRDNNSTLNHG